MATGTQNLAVQLIFYKHFSRFRSSQSWHSDSPPAAGRLWCLQAKQHLSTKSQKVERGIRKRVSLGFQILLQASCLAWPSGCWESLAVLLTGSWKQISSLKSFCKLHLTLHHLPQSQHSSQRLCEAVQGDAQCLSLGLSLRYSSSLAAHRRLRDSCRETVHRLLSNFGVGYGYVATMWPQYEYDRSPFISQQNKVYLAKRLQHLIG